MKKYFRRGYFPDDAESAYSRWRAAATLIAVPPGMGADAFEEFVKTSWLAGWYTRGEVDYGEPDTLADQR